MAAYSFTAQAVVQVTAQQDDGVAQAVVEVEGGDGLPVFIDLVSEDLR
jgi:hypothetical protein